MASLRQPTTQQVLRLFGSQSIWSAMVLLSLVNPPIALPQTQHPNTSSVLLVQVVPHIPPPVPLPPPIVIPQTPGPLIPTPQPLPPPAPLPPIELPQPRRDVLPSPPPPPLSPTVRVPPACHVTTLSSSSPSDCSTRSITYGDIYNDLSSCISGPCFANKFLSMDQVVVIYPSDFSDRQAAVETLRAELAEGINQMGDYLKKRARSGASGLPSIEAITNLVDQAIDEIKTINQPVGESREQRRKRLGLGPATTSLAKMAGNS